MNERESHRKENCPLLLRVFYSENRRNTAADYSRELPINELQIHTWNDATLKEMATLIKKINPTARKKGTMITFALVWPDHRQPVFRMRDIGSVCTGSPADTDNIMLKDCKFIIGDYLDVYINQAKNRNRNDSRSFDNSRM